METIKIEFPIKSKGPYVESLALNHMVSGLNKLLSIGAIKGNLDEIVVNYEIKNPGGWAIAEIQKSALVDGSKLNTVGSFLSFPVDKIQDEVNLEERQFSAASIQERLRISGLQTKIKFRYTVLDYKKYYAGSKSKLEANPASMEKLKNLFIQDIMGIFNEVMPYIQEGKQLAALTGLQTITDGLNTCAKDLSQSYRLALRQAKNGQLGASVFKNLQAKYREFMNLLIPQVFPGIEEILKGQTRTHSRITGTVTVQTSNPDKLFDLLSYIDQLAKPGHNVSITIDKGEEDEKEFNWDGDGSDTMTAINISKVESSKNYSVGSDGLIKLFEND